MFQPFIFVKAVIQAVEVIHCAVLIVNNSDEGDGFIAVIAESKKNEKWGHLKNMVPINETRGFAMDKRLEMDGYITWNAHLICLWKKGCLVEWN